MNLSEDDNYWEDSELKKKCNFFNDDVSTNVYKFFFSLIFYGILCAFK